ncbi:MAG TPA: DUF2141 domain-containing protein [Sphingomonas sp.]
MIALAALLAGAAAANAVPIGSDSIACTADRGPAILANISGLKDRKGRLRLELYPADKADFLKDDRDLIAEGKTFRRIWADIPAHGAIAICIRAPAPGRYAVVMIHDHDGAGKFDIWTDGVAVPSNRKIGRGKPSVAEAAITVGDHVVVSDMRAQYLRGLGGFSPIPVKR